MLHAVVVGVDHYRDPTIKDLCYAAADATAVAGLLNRIETQARDVRVLLNEKATRRQVMTAIGEDLPRAVRDDDVVLLYFAGHGTPETEGGPDDVSRYLVTHDTEFESIYATGIDLERDVWRWFERLTRPRLVLLVIDACFSGRAGGRTFEGPRLRRLRETFRDVAPAALDDLHLGEGRLMLSACDDTEVAWEEGRLGHGVFTHFLLRGPNPLPGTATAPAALAQAGRRTIGIHALYDWLATEVRAHTAGRQTPVLNGRSAHARLPYLW
jgi:uncharacterized caspase-like protein